MEIYGSAHHTYIAEPYITRQCDSSPAKKDTDRPDFVLLACRSRPDTDAPIRWVGWQDTRTDVPNYRRNFSGCAFRRQRLAAGPPRQDHGPDRAGTLRSVSSSGTSGTTAPAVARGNLLRAARLGCACPTSTPIYLPVGKNTKCLAPPLVRVCRGHRWHQVRDGRRDLGHGPTLRSWFPDGPLPPFSTDGTQRWFLPRFLRSGRSR